MARSRAFERFVRIPEVSRDGAIAVNNAELFYRSLVDSKAITALAGHPEDLYFDAKRCTIPLNNSDKDHLAEALSGFANSDGGTVIYGLVASGGDRTKPDVVTGPDPIKDVSALQAEILALVGSSPNPLSSMLRWSLALSISSPATGTSWSTCPPVIAARTVPSEHANTINDTALVFLGWSTTSCRSSLVGEGDQIFGFSGSHFGATWGDLVRIRTCILKSWLALKTLAVASRNILLSN
jgi:hypothetical protein